MSEGKRASTESSQRKQPLSESDSLDKRLDNCGLDIIFWADILKTQLGITSGNQVEHLDQKELDLLCTKKRHDWEEAALKKFVGLESKALKAKSSNEIRESTEQAQISKRCLEAKKEFENFKELLPDSPGIKETETKLRELLEIPPETWLYIDNSSSMSERMDAYEKKLSETELNLKTKDIPPNISSIVQNVSDGDLLRGRSSIGKEHRQLIQPPTNIVLRQPRVSLESKTFEVESKEQADSLNVSLNKTGGGLSWPWVIQTDVENAPYKQNKSNSLKKFFSRIQFFWISTGSVEFRPETLKLSDEALESLKKIEQDYRIKGDNDNVQAACKKFFETYGSHLYVGIIRLGGVFKLEAKYDSQTTTSMEIIKNLVTMRGDLACWFGSVNSLSSNLTSATKTGIHKPDEFSIIQVNTLIRGGPEHVSSLQPWKAGLVSDSSTWAVIECESKNPHDYIKVCDLVQNCPDSFKDVNKLGKLLYNALEPGIPQKVSDPVMNYFNGAYSQAMSSILKVETNQGTTYGGAMMTLVELMWEGIALFNTKEYWIKLIQEKRNIAEFLVKIPHQTFDDCEKSLVKLRLKRLIEHLSIHGFPEKGMILNWLNKNKSILEKESKEFEAAELVINEIKQAINAAFSNTLSIKVKKEIFAQLSMSKQHLIAEVLLGLTEPGNFDSYKSYIENPKAFVSKRTKSRIQKHLFEQNSVLSTHCHKLVYSHVFFLVNIAEENILAATKNCIKETENGMTEWIHFFVECVKPNLIIPAKSVKNIQKSGDINILRFHNIVVENMFDLVDDIIKEIEETVFDAVIQEIWGCPSSCPFCGEPCHLGIDHLPHKAHSCFEHRPLCVTGTAVSSVNDKKELIVKTCNEMAKSHNFFNCSSCWQMCRQSGKCRVKENPDTNVDIKEPPNTDTSGEDKAEASQKNLEYWHKFKEYKTYLPNWDLEPVTSSGTSDYWKWFVYNYQEELQEEFNAQLSDIPISWSSITKQKAIASVTSH